MSDFSKEATFVTITRQAQEIERLQARLAEAEHLILRMAGEDYQRARFYVEKYDLTGERAADSAEERPACDCKTWEACKAPLYRDCKRLTPTVTGEQT